MSWVVSLMAPPSETCCVVRLPRTIGLPIDPRRQTGRLQFCNPDALRPRAAVRRLGAGIPTLYSTSLVSHHARARRGLQRVRAIADRPRARAAGSGRAHLLGARSRTERAARSDDLAWWRR